MDLVHGFDSLEVVQLPSVEVPKSRPAMFTPAKGTVPAIAEPAAAAKAIKVVFILEVMRREKSGTRVVELKGSMSKQKKQRSLCT